uniref:Ovule protein n=1 Tax=Ascaris lumbricoides TaxID=6252 RepID=A0A0M3IA82_ASCLU
MKTLEITTMQFCKITIRVHKYSKLQLQREHLVFANTPLIDCTCKGEILPSWGSSGYKFCFKIFGCLNTGESQYLRDQHQQCTSELSAGEPLRPQVSRITGIV